MNEVEKMKAMIRGYAVEGGVDGQFNDYLNAIRDLLSKAKEDGEQSEATFYLALSYVGAEMQS